MYLVLKVVHVAAVVIFLGNITIGVFWKAIADRRRDAAVVAHTIGGIIEADRYFTIPGVVTLIAAGIGTALVGQIPILGTGWVLWPLVLIVLSGLAFGPLARAQRALLALAKGGLPTEADWAKYHALSQGWNVWGGIALVLPVVAFIIMILKPNLPAFHR